MSAMRSQGYIPHGYAVKDRRFQRTVNELRRARAAGYVSVLANQHTNPFPEGDAAYFAWEEGRSAVESQRVPMRAPLLAEEE